MKDRKVSNSIVLKVLDERDIPALKDLLEANRSRFELHFEPEYSAMNQDEGLSNFIRSKLETSKNGLGYYFGIFLSGTLIGKVELYGVSKRIPKCNLAYFIDQQQEGKGIITSCLRALIDHLFDQLGYQKIELRTSTDNYPSIAIAKKLGFIEEGNLRNNYRRYNNELVDLVIWGRIP